MQVAQMTWKDPAYTRQLPSQDSLFWRFVGRHNVLFTEGEEWKLHAKSVHAALQRPPPFSDFAAVAQRLVAVIGDGTQSIKWDEMAQRVTLEVLGATILGYDFEAIKNPDSPFVNGYTRVVHALTQPAYMFVPLLEKVWPRREVESEMKKLRSFFSEVLQHKRKSSGDDVISAMLQEPAFTETDFLDNMVVLFIAGHVSFPNLRYCPH
jgi:cytochrome P450